ncbi:MAG: hypothetical protein Q4E62_06390 [Sutterellaceae bacterium]|nr:hypothetical protein [Sutterellaceae bacterium]
MSAWRFFQASPKGFFEQYADDFVIVNAQAVDAFLDKAAAFLEDNLLSRLTVCGRFSRDDVFRFCQAHTDDDIGVGVHFLASPRAVCAQSNHATITGFALNGCYRDRTHLIASSGMPETDKSPALYWTETFKRLLIEDIVPELGIRDRAVFFSFMKALAKRTAQGLNWAAIGAEVGISAPCARDWTQFLASVGVIDLIEPMSAPAPRRAKIRKKLYWTTPGLALWLSDNMTSPDAAAQSSLLENILYLAIKDAFPRAQFMHFLDTNYVKAHLIACENGVRRAYYFASETFTEKDAAKSLKSLSKIDLIDPYAFLISMSENTEELATIAELHL